MLIDCQKLETLRRVPVFEAWLNSGDTSCLEHLSRGEEVRLQSGEWLCHEGDEAAFYLVLEGELRVMKMVGDAEMLLTVHEPGVFFGEVPLMMDTPFVAGGQAAGEFVAFRLEPDAFWALFASCPGIARQITKTMAKRTQELESLSQTREKLVSLGTLAAGLAHELNNPAAAATRASAELRGAMRQVEMRAIAMHGMGFEPSQCELLKTMREAAYEHAENQPEEKMSAMQRSDSEDELADSLSEMYMTMLTREGPPPSAREHANRGRHRGELSVQVGSRPVAGRCRFEGCALVVGGRCGRRLPS